MGLPMYTSPAGILGRFQPTEHRCDPLQGESTNDAVTAFKATQVALGGPIRTRIDQRAMVDPQLELVGTGSGSDTGASGILITSTSQSPFQRKGPYTETIALGDGAVSEGAHIFVPSSSEDKGHPTLYSMYWQNKSSYPSAWRPPPLPSSAVALRRRSFHRTSETSLHRTSEGRVTKSHLLGRHAGATSLEPVLMIQELRARPAETANTSRTMRYRGSGGRDRQNSTEQSAVGIEDGRGEDELEREIARNLRGWARDRRLGSA